MITAQQQIDNALKVSTYTPEQRAAYEHGIKWGMRRAAEVAEFTASLLKTMPNAELAAASVNGLADALKSEAGK